MLIRQEVDRVSSIRCSLLRQQGHRVTPQPRIVLALLHAQDQPLSAEEVYALVCEQQPAMDVTTVYRVLQFLQNVRLAATLTLALGPQRYKYHSPGDVHHHLVCKQCGTHIQIPDALFASMRPELDAHYRFTLDIDHLLLPGLCVNCRVAPTADEAF